MTDAVGQFLEAVTEETGYSFDVNSFRFLGILFTTVAIVGAFFKLRYGIIVAPPRKKP